MPSLREMWCKLQMILAAPRVTVDLMLREARNNDPFYAKATREYYSSTQERHPKFPLIKVDQYGVALVELPGTFDEYFMTLEGSARRNFKKAGRNGYRFERIDFNTHLDGVRAIWQSTDVRQGAVPDYMREGRVQPCANPPSRTDIHDYPYFGILKDNRLVAYAGCLVAGELCAIEHIYGHAEVQADAVVPMLIISIAGYVLANYPNVKAYTYDNLLGASTNMRRFKRKFGFKPCKVTWRLG